MSEQEANEESMETSSVVPEGVRELLEQRSTYRRWLERLDEVGDDYRPAVAERVRTDYEDRLAGVAQELEGHRHELESSAKRRRGRLDDLSKAFETRSAELEEAELRFQVGEFDGDAWEEKRTELTGGLEAIEAELDEARGAVEELEQILGELAEGGAAAAREVGSAAPPAAGRPALEALDGGLAEEPAAKEPSGDAVPDSMEEGVEEEIETEVEVAAVPETGPDVTGDDGEEPASEESLVAPATASSEVSTSEESAEAEADEYRDELEFLESLSLDDPDSFDAVSRMLEDEEDR